MKLPKRLFGKHRGEQQTPRDVLRSLSGIDFLRLAVAVHDQGGISGPCGVCHEMTPNLYPVKVGSPDSALFGGGPGASHVLMIHMCDLHRNASDAAGTVAQLIELVRRGEKPPEPI